jgi:uncharacterized repeat protein (TIGR01451 family)
MDSHQLVNVAFERDDDCEKFPLKVEIVKKGEGTGTVMSIPSGLECGEGEDDCEKNFCKDQRVILEAQADEGSFFTGWEVEPPTNGECTTPDPCVITMKGSTTATATFETINTNLEVKIIDHPDAVFSGKEMTYRVSVTNRGPGYATGVHLQSSVPQTVQFVSFDDSQCSEVTNSEGDDYLECELGDIAQGEDTPVVVDVRISVESSLKGSFDITATVNSDGEDPTPDNDTDRKTIMVPYEGSIIRGRIKDKEDRNEEDEFNDRALIVMHKCEKMEEALDDIANKTIRIHIGSFDSGEIDGSFGKEKSDGRKMRFKRKGFNGKEKYVLVPSKEKIKMLIKKFHGDFTCPINVRVEIGDWSCQAEEQDLDKWCLKPKNFGNLFKFTNKACAIPCTGD